MQDSDQTTIRRAQEAYNSRFSGDKIKDSLAYALAKEINNAEKRAEQAFLDNPLGAEAGVNVYGYLQNLDAALIEESEFAQNGLLFSQEESQNFYLFEDGSMVEITDDGGVLVVEFEVERMPDDVHGRMEDDDLGHLDLDLDFDR